MRSCLIVDDSATVRRALAVAVKAARRGIQEIHEAETPAEAIILYERHKPDVVFLDMMLAGDEIHDTDGKPAKGIAVLKDLLGRRADLPVVVITGLPGSQPDVVDAISLGAIAALRKPVKAEDVKFVLESIEPDKHVMDYFG